MDLASLTPTERKIDIVHPGNGSPLGVWVSVVSLDDERMKKLRRAITDEANKKAQRGKVMKAEEIDENLDRLLINAMTGWGWEKDEAGEDQTFQGIKPEFNEKNIRKVFATLPWFRDQLNEAVGDTKSFFSN